MSALDNLKLSENFTLGEFYVSGAHPAVAARMERKIEDAVSLARLCVLLVQPIRSYIGKALKINSGYRDAELNKLVGGSATSQHYLAEAGDLDLQGEIAWVVYKWLLKDKKADVGQAIIYLNAQGVPYFLHVSTRSLKGSSKAAGDFRVKLDGDKAYYRWGADKIPGIKA